MRKLALWLSVGVVFAAVLALGALVLGLALVAAPVVLLAGYLVARARNARPREKARPAGPSVYEGEFRVLDETRG